MPVQQIVMHDVSYDGESGGPTRLEDLPPMPKPDVSSMRSQATAGCTVVLALIALLVGLPHASATYARDEQLGIREVGFSLLYLEAVIALICLCGLMWGDPGTLKRTPERCFPIPQVVLDKLRNGERLGSMENVYDGGMVYCVRCFIWRPDGTPPTYHDNVHHCSICQRCVTDFDHHCGVFGRCIAGKGYRGNMGYFKVILMMATAGIITCVFTVRASSLMPDSALSLAHMSHATLTLRATRPLGSSRRCRQCRRRITRRA